jgi:TusA-related sulfurtransferase
MISLPQSEQLRNEHTLNERAFSDLNLGDQWIECLVQKDFPGLAHLCKPDVHARLMTPRRIDTLENAADLCQKVESWFGECTLFQKNLVRTARVGEKLAIFYRLTFEEKGQLFLAEQQIYCSLQDGRIHQLSLLCSGFQPVPTPAQQKDLPQEAHPFHIPADSPVPHADDLLIVNTAAENASTCALLTPAIKHKLAEMTSGQVLEVRVDDPTAAEDIEAWCRLSGNLLLKQEAVGSQDLRVYLLKK